MLATRNFVRAEDARDRNFEMGRIETIEKKFEELAGRVGKPKASEGDFFRLMYDSLFIGGRPTTHEGRLEALEQKLAKLFDFLGVYHQTTERTSKIVRRKKGGRA